MKVKVVIDIPDVEALKRSKNDDSFSGTELEYVKALIEGALDPVAVDATISEDIKDESHLDARYLIARYLAAYHEKNSILGEDPEVNRLFRQYRQIPYWQSQEMKTLCEELHQVLYDGGPQQYIEVGELLIEVSQREEGKEWLETFLRTTEHSH